MHTCTHLQTHTLKIVHGFIFNDVYVLVGGSAQGGQKRNSDPLDLEYRRFWATMWVSELNELGFSARRVMKPLKSNLLQEERMRRVWYREHPCLSGRSGHRRMSLSTCMCGCTRTTHALPPPPPHVLFKWELWGCSSGGGLLAWHALTPVLRRLSMAWCTSAIPGRWMEEE